LEFSVVEQVDDRQFPFTGAVDSGLDENGAGVGSDCSGACYYGRDDVARMGVPFSTVSNKRVGAALVEGAAHAWWPELFSNLKSEFGNESHP
jgi:hypothetical protein